MGLTSGGLGGFIRGLGERIGNPLDWGKQTADPRNAQLQGGGFMRGYLEDRMAGVNDRGAPQADRTRVGAAAQMNAGPQNQFRDREMSLADQLGRVANGQQAGAGELAVQRQMRQAAALQQGQAASQRGGMAGLAGRAAARGIGNNAVNAAGMGAQAAMGDQAQAQGLLAGVLGQGRGADIGIAGANMDAQNQRTMQQAALDQSTSLANMQAKLAQTGMNDEQSIALMAQYYGISVAEMQARLGQEAQNMGQQGIIGDLLQAGGMLGSAAITK